jgi:hypothetical protein
MNPLTGADDAIKAAVNNSYEAVVMVVILFGFLGVFAFISKWFISTMDKRLQQADVREERLALRVTELERFVESTLMKLIAECSAALANNTQMTGQLIGTLEKRPCFWDSERQAQAIERLAMKIKDKV